MSTLLPPKPKPVQRAELQRASDQQPLDLVPDDVPNVVVQLRAADTGAQLSGELHIPGNSTAQQLNQLVNKLLATEDDRVPYTFTLLSDPADPTSAAIDVDDNIWTNVLKPGVKSSEEVLTLVYTPQAVFRVRAVSRCSAAIAGHGNAILATSFSPKSASRMVTASGDGTARIWDCDTQTPMHTLKGHKNWVLVANWAPDASMIVTGSMDNTLRVWDPKTGKPMGDAMKAHTKWITSIAWEPYHLWDGAARLASASKDATIRVWNAVNRRVEVTLAGHTASVTCVKWAGDGRIYSTSEDKTVRIWEPKHGRCLHILKAHAHWVNHMAFSTDFVLRAAFYDHTREVPSSVEEKRQKARERFEKAATVAGELVERLVTASDDFTMYLWEPARSTKPIARLLGHQKAVNHVSFSPDGRLIASASFDNSVKLWDARDGKFITTLRGHVAAVYQCAFSADSRLLVSSSKDSTLKVWDVRKGKLHTDLPGHQDEVFAVDWSPDGAKVASGGKDKLVRIWTH